MILSLSLIVLAAIAALGFWWHRRRIPPAAAPVEEDYVCFVCDETDCICQKKSDTEKESPS